ncbi:helix-turn-helix domain-containing protein [Exiguobacterium antarcticum]|uniref:Helix-turn-helix domain-containing protein n=1 Tax=Exiguobacterium antarcticum TaxID=132920 RepID=A0ABT6R076_9BACL|nr:helix-turn-helix domain-containing protein [Exiguobacterium antarcticum]MDI3234339.1 helix-turn-helix domain-containing protein [Exiguobacterium antarcticum]
MEETLIPTALCPRVEHAFEILGKKWTGLILRHLMTKTCRFNEIQDAIPELSGRMLTERMKELEAEGIVVRTVIPERPIKIQYSLTDKGRQLEPVIRSIEEWAELQD